MKRSSFPRCFILFLFVCMGGCSSSPLVENAGEVEPPVQPRTLHISVQGPYNSGKSSLVRRIYEKTFEEEDYCSIYTEFVRFDMNMEGNDLKVQVWDPEPHYRGKVWTNNRRQDAVILAFDLTSREDLFPILEFYVQSFNRVYWGDERKLYIVGCKSDLGTERAFSRQDMMSFVSSVDAAYYETSSKDDVMVSELFHHIASDFCGIPCDAPLIRSAKSARK